MSDTPRTDKATCYITDVFGTQFETTNPAIARQLERERDKARDAIRVLAEHGESEIQRITKERDEWSAMCGRYKQERDTLVQKLDAWQEIAEHLHHLVQHPAYGVEQAIRRMDVLEAYKHLKNGH